MGPGVLRCARFGFSEPPWDSGSVAHSGNPVVNAHFLAFLPAFSDLLPHSLIVLSGIISQISYWHLSQGLLFCMPHVNVCLILFFKRQQCHYSGGTRLRKEERVSAPWLHLWRAKTIYLSLYFYHGGHGLLWWLLLSFTFTSAMIWGPLSQHGHKGIYEWKLLLTRRNGFTEIFILMDFNTCFLLTVHFLNVFFMTI